MGCQSWKRSMTDTAPELTEQQVAAALSVQATAAGAAELLSRWLEHTVTPAEVIQAIWPRRALAASRLSVQRPKVAHLSWTPRSGSGPWPDRAGGGIAVRASNPHRW